MEANKTKTIPIVNCHKGDQEKKNPSNLGDTISYLTSVFFALFSPNIVVIVATILSCGQNGGRAALKALHSQSALARCHIHSGEIRGAKLHPTDKVSGSILCTETQIQDDVGPLIMNSISHNPPDFKPILELYQRNLHLQSLLAPVAYDP